MNELEYHQQQEKICHSLAARAERDPALWRSYMHLADLHRQTGGLIEVAKRLRDQIKVA